jgi:hypothetical protein
LIPELEYGVPVDGGAVGPGDDLGAETDSHDRATGLVETTDQVPERSIVGKPVVVGGRHLAAEDQETGMAVGPLRQGPAKMRHGDLEPVTARQYPFADPAGRGPHMVLHDEKAHPRPVAM